jgi:hypothetical protein
VIHAKAIDQQTVLQVHHVEVTVAGKFRTQAVARLARSAVTKAVGEDDEILRGVQGLPWSEQLAREV